MQRIAVQDRRAALLAAAIRVIARGGVAAATVRAVAAEAEMPFASVHYVFASRDAMLGELLVAVLDDEREAASAATRSARTLREFITGALLAWLDRAVQDPDAEAVLHALVAWSRVSEIGGLTAVSLYAAYERNVLAFVEASRERFGARWVLSDREIARYALVHTDGVAARWLVDGDSEGARRMLLLGADALLALAEGGA